MKRFALILASCLLSASVSATCFVAADEAAAVGLELPTQVCVNDIKLDLVVPGLPQNPFYKLSVDSSLGLANNNRVIFKKVGELFEAKATVVLKSLSYGICDSSERTIVEFTVLVDENLKTQDLKIVGKNIYNPDTCHSSDRVLSLQYQ